MSRPDQTAALECAEAFAMTDFRGLATVPTLVLHGDNDGTVLFEGAGRRTRQAIPHSELVVLTDLAYGWQRQPCQGVQRRTDQVPRPLRTPASGRAGVSSAGFGFSVGGTCRSGAVLPEFAGRCLAPDVRARGPRAAHVLGTHQPQRTTRPMIFEQGRSAS